MTEHQSSQINYGQIPMPQIPTFFKKVNIAAISSTFSNIKPQRAMLIYQQKAFTQQQLQLKAFKSYVKLFDEEDNKFQAAVWFPLVCSNFKQSFIKCITRDYMQNVLSLFENISPTDLGVSYKYISRSVQLVCKSLQQRQKRSIPIQTNQINLPSTNTFCTDCQTLTAQLINNKTKQNNFYPTHRRMCFSCHHIIVQRFYWAVNLLGITQQKVLNAVASQQIINNQKIKQIINNLNQTALNRRPQLKDVTQFIARLSMPDFIFFNRQLGIIYNSFNYLSMYNTLQGQKRAAYLPIFYIAHPTDQNVKKGQSGHYAIHLYLRHNPEQYSPSITKYKLIYKQKAWHFAGDLKEKYVSQHQLNQSFIKFFNLIFKPLNFSFLKHASQAPTTGKRSAITTFFDLE